MEIALPQLVFLSIGFHATYKIETSKGRRGNMKDAAVLKITKTTDARDLPVGKPAEVTFECEVERL